MTSSGRPWLTIVTVVKDAREDFRRTLASVSAQELDEVDYVIVDSSTDITEIPAALAEHPSVRSRYVWNPPTGIYPAMNAGLALAVGEYVYFANAGDAFFADDVLERVRLAVEPDHPAWLFGAVQIVGTDGTRVITPAWDYQAEKTLAFSRGHFPSHQGTFVRRDLLVEQGGFDTRYSIVADYASFLRLSKVADPVRLDMVIATFAEGGVSTIRWQESFRQFHRARSAILAPRGMLALRERWETARRYALVFAHREIIGRLRGAGS